MSGINGKVVAITGASSGIGEATALLLAERGARLVLGARRSDRLETLTARISEAGGEAVHARTDVKRRDQVEGLVALAGIRYGRLDVLISNAGVAPNSLLDDRRWALSLRSAWFSASNAPTSIRCCAAAGRGDITATAVSSMPLK